MVNWIAVLVRSKTLSIYSVLDTIAIILVASLDISRRCKMHFFNKFRLFYLGFVGAILLSGHHYCFGVVVSSTIENTVELKDDRGFGNSVIVRGSSGVYLGNRWVLTVAHVGAGETVVPGLGTFTPVDGSSIQIKNPPEWELEEDVDLMLFRLTEDPGLPHLRIADFSPDPADVVIWLDMERIENLNKNTGM